MIDTVADPDYDAWWASLPGVPRSRTDVLVDLLPGAAAEGLLPLVLEGVELGECADEVLLDLAAGWERMLAYAAARQAEVIAVFASRRPPQPREELSHRRDDPPLIPVPDGVPAVARTAGDEISVELNLSPGAAAWRVSEAVTMTHRLPQLLGRMRAGQLSVQHARAVLEETRDLSVGDAVAVTDRVLARAGGKTHQQLRYATKKAALAVNPDQATERRKKASKDRKVEYQAGENGMAWLTAFLPAVEATAIYERLDQAARTTRSSGDERTLDQLRADALVEAVLEGAGPAGRPLVNITMPAGTALGLSNEPAEMAGYGPIDADYARTVAGSGMWRRISTNPTTGIPTNVGRTYRPPKRLRDLVRARYPECPFPTCTTPATRTDFDHVKPHSQGGETSAANGATPCRRHHRTKHTTGWKIRKRPDHSIEWTTPAGKQHVQQPATYNDNEPPPF